MAGMLKWYTSYCVYTTLEGVSLSRLSLATIAVNYANRRNHCTA